MERGYIIYQGIVVLASLGPLIVILAVILLVKIINEFMNPYR